MSIEVLDTDTNARKITYDYSGRRARPLMSWSEYTAKPRLYVSYDEANDGYTGSLTPMEHILFDRWTNQVEMYKTHLPAIIQSLGLPEGTTAKWSQKAGCSCGCSPAFILTLPEGETIPRADFWATLGDPELVAKAKVWRAAGAAIRLRKQGRDLLLNAQQAFREGHSVVRLKELKTWYSPDLERTGSWAQSAY